MATVSSSGKLAYIYDASSDTWFPIAGAASPSSNIAWTGTHSFSNTVSFQSVLTAKAGINNFADAAARDLAIPAPVADGTVCFLRSTKEIQYYANGSWRTYGDNALMSAKTSSFTLSLPDAGKTIDAESSSAIVITVPKNSSVAFPLGSQIAVIRSGAGDVSFAAEDSTVTINSKNSNKKIAARYAPATIIKKSENSWILIGDLTA